MELLLLIILVFVVLIISSRWIYRTPVAGRSLELHFIYILILPLLGALIGSSGFHLIDESMQIQTQPIVHLSLGWLGLYSGLYLGFQDFKKYTKNILIFSLLDGLFTFLVLFIVAGLFMYAMGVSLRHIFWGGLALSIAGVELSPMALSIIRRRLKDKSSFGYLFQSLTAMSGILAIFLLGFFSPMLTSNSAIEFLGMLFLEILLGLLMGGITVYAIHKVRHSQEFLLMMIGILFITSGFAFYFRFNAIFMNLIVGSTVATFSLRRNSVQRLLAPLEEPAYLFLLLYAGMSMDLSWMWLAVAILLMTLRYGIKLWTFKAYFGRDVMNTDDARRLTPAQCALGNLSFAVGINLLMVFGGDISRTILGMLTFQYVLAFGLTQVLMNRKGGQ